MCGRTIRVPQLDGTIAPLPKPRLNHGDSGLAKALDALASLASDQPVAAQIDEQPAKPVAIVLAPAPAVEPVPIPVPWAPESLSPHRSEGLSRPTPASLDAQGMAWPVADPLRELSEMQSPSGARGRRPSPGRRTLVMTGVVCGVIGISCGFLLGRMTSRRDSAAASAAGVPNATAPEVAVQPDQALLGQGGEAAPASPSDLKLAIAGRVTYMSATGESMPDVGSRVLALPALRPETSKLLMKSFRAGANSSELKLAQASVRSLGGDFTLAGPDGHYEIRLPSTGKYLLLIVSKYQGRDPETQTDAARLAVLQNWFDQPLGFVGQTQMLAVDVQFDGQRHSLRDHVFTKVD